MSAAWELTLEEAAARIAARELSTVELTDAVLERLRETEPAVHAWASVDVDGARAAAARLDAELAVDGPRSPMHGIPVGFKDVIDTAGWPTEAGSRVLAGRLPEADAEAVARLRAAGAVVIGKTVTHEFAYGQDDPPTRSPWDPSRYPGGSSAGSGVAVAVGSALGTLGTDTGGSIRNPGAVNAIVGLKPTNGLVSNRGVIPVSTSLDQVGPLSRTVAGAALMLQAMATGPAVPDYRAALDAPLGRPRVGVDRAAWERCGVTPAVREAVETALVKLEALGAEIVEVDLPVVELALPTGLTLFVCEAHSWHRDLFAERPRDYAQATRIMIELGALVSGSDYVTAQKVREVIRRDVRATFERLRLDVMAGPTLPAPAWPAEDLRTDFTRSGEQHGDLAGALRLLNWANICGMPALSVPCGASPEGLPLGLHLVGRPFADADVLRLAHAYQTATTWHELRPRLDALRATPGG
jgi:Asp-tRNA(Asn)/Glu-tRNA(Gln) amidotransferase A subunit family amidase